MLILTARLHSNDGKHSGRSEESCLLVLPLPHADGMLLTKRMFHFSDKSLSSAAVSLRVMDLGKDSIPAFTEISLVASKAKIINNSG